MKVAVYPGSFDPITEGHLDIIRRSSKTFDELVVLVLINPDKKGLFDIEEREALIQKVTKNIANVKVEAFHGLLVNYMKERELNIIVKGLRAVTDFEYEFQMALMNRKLSPTIETVFMMTSAQYSYLSSSSVKQVAKFGGDLNDLVPREIINDVVNKILNK
jgi:pantetheine-phosphate adenylyltransferase